MTTCHTCEYARYHREIPAGPDGPREPGWIECAHPAISGRFSEAEIDWRKFNCWGYESKQVFDTEKVYA